MIDPLLVTTERVGQLPPAAFGLSDKIPHEIGEDLKQGTVQQLADVIGEYLGGVGGLAFNPNTIQDGETLPVTTSPEFMLLGVGTFHNVGGNPDIITTDELNVVTSNGSFWSLAVEIPINVELAGITQKIRSGYTQTTPSENTVFLALADKLSLGGYTGTAHDIIDLINFTILFPKIQFTYTTGAFDFDLGTNALAKAVFWNGALLDDDDFSQTGTILTILFTLTAGDKIKPI
jgi:hypothetical protein